MIKGMCSEGFESLFKKRDILRTPYKTVVGYSVNKRLRVFDGSFIYQIGPELTGKIELGINLQRLGNVDTAVTFLWRVVKFTECCMSGSSVVPRIRTLLCRAAQHFIDRYVQTWIKFLQKHSERGAH